MKQVLQNLKTGIVEVADVPCPVVGTGRVLVQTRATLISAGTERMLVEFAQSSLLAKARGQPDKVRQVLDKIKTDGLLPTLEAVFSRLDEPLPLGYCNAGVVVEVGEGVTEFTPGDRIVSNGPHAEMVAVPKNLCAKIPDNVSDDQAAFTVLASIGLQGIRLIEPTIGETIVVTGLGLIGLASVQLLVSAGCRVIGIDPDPKRAELATAFGAQVINIGTDVDPVAIALALTNGRGVDGVLITASSKDSNLIKQAAAMCRKRGRIVLVGVVGMELSRSDFYKKEISFQVSCSYGPGRYDPAYEEKGQDYPLPFVRWTQQRNFEAVLQLMASGRVDMSRLITRRLSISDASTAYSALTSDRDALGLVLTFNQESSSSSRIVAVTQTTTAASGQPVIGLIGAGNFAKMTLLPALRGLPAQLKTIVSAGGVSGLHSARKFGFQQAATDYRSVLSDPQINLVIILTRHNLHAKMVLESLAAGKHVAVEKPLCLTRDELGTIKAVHAVASTKQLLVGFNRRFSPHAQKARQLLGSRSSPLCMNMTVNAGAVSPESWVHDPNVGGGRIIGEGCHWFDLLSFLAGAPIRRVLATNINAPPGQIGDDKSTITLSFADGSIGTIHYFANGHKSYPKESLEIFADGKVIKLDNFRRMHGWGYSGFSSMNLWRQDKGHREEMRQLVDAVTRGGPPVMPFDQIENVMLATFAAVDSAKSNLPVVIA
jgi:predicted dehydrogenase/threonine dehydrogenase-like Zn-dependent dehydrogenase